MCYGFESSNINGGTNIAVGRRYNDDGSVDSGFNPGLTYPSFVLGSTIYNSPGILDANGSMRFVYPSTSGVNNIASVKLNSNGDPDLTYGLNGMNYTSVESDPNTVHHYRERDGVIYGVRLKTNADQDMRAYSLD